MSVLDRVQAGGRPGVADRLLADAAGAADAARGLADAAAAELFARPRRLDESLRSELLRLLAALVTAVEDDLRHRLLERLGPGVPAELVATLSAAEVALAAPILERASLLADAEMMAVLLRRIEARRLTELLRAGEMPVPSLMDDLMRSGDEVLAGMAMACLLADSRRHRDTPDMQSPARTDLPAELQHRLVWRVAAALRHHVLLRGLMSPAVADRAIPAAATAVLAGYDEGETLESQATRIARRLHQRQRLDDATLVRAVAEGWLALAVAGLAARTGLDFDPAWAMAADPGGSRLAVLLRAAGVGRTAAAAILRAVAGDGGRVPDWIEDFDWLDPAAAREAIAPYAADPAYADALAAVDRGLAGERPR